MKVGVLLGAFFGGLFSVLILVLLIRAFDQDAALIWGTIFEKKIDVWTVVILPLISTFAGAAAGSYFTYRLQAKIKNSEEEYREVYLMRQTCLALEAQLQDLGGLKKSLISPVAEDVLRFLNMPAVVGHTGVSERINNDVSIPLIRLNRPDILQKARMAEKTYLNAVSVHDSYQELSREYKKRLRDGGININDISSFRYKTALAGAEIIAQLYTIGEALILAVDDGLRDIVEVMDDLADCYEKNFKKSVNRMIRTVPIEADVFTPTPGPRFKSLEEVMEASGHQPKYHDPFSGEPRPIRKLALPNWRTPYSF